MNEHFSTVTFVVEVMFNLKNSSLILATVLKYRSILHSEVQIHSLNAECENHKPLFLHFVYLNKK